MRTKDEMIEAALDRAGDWSRLAKRLADCESDDEARRVWREHRAAMASGFWSTDDERK